MINDDTTLMLAVLIANKFIINVLITTNLQLLNLKRETD